MPEDEVVRDLKKQLIRQGSEQAMILDLLFRFVRVPICWAEQCYVQKFKQTPVEYKTALPNNTN